MVQPFFKRYFQEIQRSSPHGIPEWGGQIQVADSLAFIFQPDGLISYMATGFLFFS
jgi:hypothetical protein